MRMLFYGYGASRAFLSFSQQELESPTFNRPIGIPDLPQVLYL